MGIRISKTHAPITALALIGLASIVLGPPAPRAAQASAMHGHEHKHAGGTTAYGQPGAESDVTRTIEVTALDSMRHEPSTITVRAGETVKFVVRNAGRMRHEFMLGDTKAQQEHAETMRAHPDTVHEDPNAVTVEPAETKTLIWRFAAPGVVEGACHIPGHYEAGMFTRIHVMK